MRAIVIAACLAAPCFLGACKGVRASNIRVGWGEQPQFPLHVHPSLSGLPPIPNERADGRGTRGSPLTPPLVMSDFPDPPQYAITPPGPMAQSPGRF